ncbi:MAG: hypothetical protein WAN54_14310 [Syntrophobacteraceae bacterium]
MAQGANQTFNIASGTNQAFTITPAPQCQLTGVLVDGTSIGAVSTSAFTTVVANHTIQATFAASPVADAGPDQVVASGSISTLNGSNSTDTVSGIASYKWTQLSGPRVALSNPSAAICTFTAPNVASGKMLAFNLAVTNKAGITGSASCFVNVSGTDQAPSANAGVNQNVTPYTNVTLNGSGSSDPNGMIASYNWVQISGPSVEILNANTSFASFTAPDPPGFSGASLVFQLLVTDYFGLTTRDQCTVNVMNADPPPVANAGSDQIALRMFSVTLDGSGSHDPVNSTGSYRWKQLRGAPVTLSNPAAMTTVFTAPAVVLGAQNAELLFVLTVTDANDQLTDTAKCVVTVKP